MTTIGTARNHLLDAGLWFTRRVVQLPGVVRVALIGSITTSRPDPKDIDFLLTVSDGADLAPIAALGRGLKGRAQSHNLDADIFLAGEHGRYLGRTCSWAECRPGIRASCDALHCGIRPYLHDDLETLRLPQALVSQPPVEVWPTLVKRCELPGDLERFLSEFTVPPNYCMQRTAGRLTGATS